MNIVIMRLNTADFGKIGKYNVQEIGLSKALKKNGHNPSVIYLYRKTKKIHKDENIADVYYLPSISFGIHGIFKTNSLRLFSPEAIILFSDNQLWSKNVIRWCKKNMIPVVVYFGAVLSDTKKPLNQIYTRMILFRNKKYYNYSINIAKTEKVRNEMVSLDIPFNGIIPVGLDFDILKNNKNEYNIPTEQLSTNKTIISLIFIGRLVDYKNPILACLILIELIKRGIKSNLVIIGKGPLEDKLNKFIIDNNINEYVAHIPQVDYDRMADYYTEADCMINLSRKEIFGMAILEAMYYGVPVVAQIAPGPMDIIDNSIDGFLIDTDDPKIWANAILEAIKDKDKITNNAKLKIVNKYMWTKSSMDFIDAINKKNEAK